MWSTKARKLSMAFHQNGSFGEGKILLMLQFHDRLNTVNQVLLSFLPKTFFSA